MSYQIFCPFCGKTIVSDVVNRIDKVNGEWQCDNGHTFLLQYVDSFEGEVKGRGINQKTNLNLQVEGIEKRLYELQEKVDGSDVKGDVDFLVGMVQELVTLSNYYVIRMVHK